MNIDKCKFVPLRNPINVIQINDLDIKINSNGALCPFVKINIFVIETKTIIRSWKKLHMDDVYFCNILRNDFTSTACKTSSRINM